MSPPATRCNSPHAPSARPTNATTGRNPRQTAPRPTAPDHRLFHADHDGLVHLHLHPCTLPYHAPYILSAYKPYSGSRSPLALPNCQHTKRRRSSAKRRKTNTSLGRAANTPLAPLAPRRHSPRPNTELATTLPGFLVEEKPVVLWIYGSGARVCGVPLRTTTIPRTFPPNTSLRIRVVCQRIPCAGSPGGGYVYAYDESGSFVGRSNPVTRPSPFCPVFTYHPTLFTLAHRYRPLNLPTCVFLRRLYFEFFHLYIYERSFFAPYLRP
uniref:Uncharacterized protein n=1 Tax=Mycena chlorophos TaxID=658473 RepID=A0ABQ0LHC6_MYCCL|nr:predicted protein [Mycena chlorophos]